MIRWEDRFNIGIKKIDTQHRRILDILNQIASIDDKADSRKIEGIFSDLRDYIQDHFRLEEQFMESVDYPGLAEQRAEHARFIDKLCDYQKDFLKYRSFIPINLTNFVWDWFSGHILGTDKKMVPYLEAQKVR